MKNKTVRQFNLSSDLKSIEGSAKSYNQMMKEAGFKNVKEYLDSDIGYPGNGSKR